MLPGPYESGTNTLALEKKNWATYEFNQMHRFMHSYEALLSTHFNIILPTVFFYEAAYKK